MRSFHRFVALTLALGLAAFAPAARAEALSEHESIRLTRGETVVREHTWEPGDSRYIGGVTYTIVDAAPAELTSMFDDIDAYRRVIPRTKRARLVAVERGGDRLIELVQGNSLVQAEYTIRVRQEAPSTNGRREVRFWLEPSRLHEIDDAWGFFRVEPFITPAGDQRVLLTYGILVDVGPGLVRELFEERVRTALLSVPQLMRRYVAEARQNGY